MTGALFAVWGGRFVRASLSRQKQEQALRLHSQTAQERSNQAREVACTIKVTQGYLAIRCENSYTGELSLDEQGRLRITKADQDSHGFGLAQMRAIAEKHGSILDLRYTGDRFTVQTALKLR